MKFKLKAASAIGAAVLVGCGLLYANRSGSENIELAKEAVESVLKDPGSVKYRNIKEYYPASVCGEFNARNSMGGYGSFEFFLFEADTGRLEFSPIESRVTAVCSSYRKDGADFLEKIQEIQGR